MLPAATLASFRPAPLEDTMSEVETRLAALGAALRARDAVAIEGEAAELQRALARAVEQFATGARTGPVPPALRARLGTASVEVAAQREMLARATAALDRAIDVLLPRSGQELYSMAGANDRGALRGGGIQA